jgi:hypothetical protein
MTNGVIVEMWRIPVINLHKARFQNMPYKSERKTVVL